MKINDIPYNKDYPYTKVHNNVIEDTKLSSKALGLFMRLWFRTSDFEFNEAQLVHWLPEGGDATRSAMTELKKRGYLKIINHGGHTRKNTWVLNDCPDNLIKPWIFKN